MTGQVVRMTVNGRPVEAQVEPRTHLADFLRETVGLTGTHLGCEHGVCGACTLEVDGVPVRSCIAFAAASDGARIRTVEGFDDDAVMAALRAAFKQHHALQCGYCTPGMLITARDIVRRLPGADEARIREELSGNLCRCTGYMGIVRAIQSVLAHPPDLDTDRDAGIPDLQARSETLPRAEPRGEKATGGDGADAPAGTGHRIRLDAPPDAVWQVLRDPAAAVRCMPGAELTGPADESPLAFRMTAAVGPMRAAFEGTATVDYDDAGRSGVIEGSGHDTRSRSTARGRVDFAVQPAGSGSELSVSLDYAIEGPLAQFSRGAVVDAVVEQIMERFARNMAAAASGKTVSDAAPAGGIGLLLTGLWRRLRRWLGS